jgi:hypothetical protein
MVWHAAKYGEKKMKTIMEMYNEWKEQGRPVKVQNGKHNGYGPQEQRTCEVNIWGK